MVKATMEIRAKAVVLYDEKLKTANEISQLYNISGRTLRRWHREFKTNGIDGLAPKKTGPKIGKHKTSEALRQRIISIKRRFPAWGARRIKHQFDLPIHWVTVHKILKRIGLLFRINANSQPVYGGTWEKFPSWRSWDRVEYLNIGTDYRQVGKSTWLFEPG